jgi:Leucine-rich repeat (LRR) protein/GH25 family lysozyme M1 (1,4-beta-N-acetylmuramidase)
MLQHTAAKAQNNGVYYQIPAAEYDALVNLYNSSAGAQWADNGGWLDPAAKNWDGVDIGGVQYDPNGNVVAQGHVYGLDLIENQLKGTIPSSLGNLTQLDYLDLSFNQLTGTIPSALGNLAQLQDLYLYGNRLSGSIPSTLGNLSLLQHLDLGGEQLSGTIPSTLGNLTQLQFLSLQDNQLSGSIPSSLGNLTQLQDLELAINQLTGTIPSSLGNLTQLQSLEFGVNQLTGTIPSTLGSLLQLRSLNLGANQLTGTIPSALGNLTQLQSLDLGANQLSGAIPDSLGNLTQLNYLDLSFLKLTGTIPDSFGNLGQLQHLDLTLNTLTGTIPSSLGSLSQLLYLSLFGNQLTGAIPDTFGNLTQLQYLDLSANQLSGAIPSSLGGLSRLQDLFLGGNNLTGDIPDSLFQLPLLLQLDLDSNALVGTIPDGPTVPTPLNYLNLSGNILTGPIPDSLSAFSELTDLDLSDNALTGSIPDSLSALTNLTYLILSSNTLKGNIPNIWNNLSHLADVELENNALSGDVPDLTLLPALSSLNVQNNWLDVWPWTQSSKNISRMTSVGISVLADPQNSIVATDLDWDTSTGILPISPAAAFSVGSAPLPSATSGRVFFAHGTNFQDIISPAGSFTIPAGLRGPATNLVSASLLAAPPDGTTNLLFVVDPDNLITSSNWLAKSASVQWVQFGIDVSHFQDSATLPGVIDWNSVKGSGLSFVYVKASEGAHDGEYPGGSVQYLQPNADGAIGARLIVGVYHRAVPTVNPSLSGATNEAINFLGRAGQYIGTGFLAPGFDLEEGTAQAYKTSYGAAALRAWVAAWLQYVFYQTGGVTPCVYTSQSVLDILGWTVVSPYPLWIATYSNDPTGQPFDGTSWTNWFVQQWTKVGTCPGISGNVDIDSFNGDLTALLARTWHPGSLHRLVSFFGAGGGPIQPPQGGTMHLEVFSPGQQQITVQASSDMATWADLATVPTTYGNAVVTDPTAGAHNVRFYRAKLSP